jgi:hypothetical protein
VSITRRFHLIVPAAYLLCVGFCLLNASWLSAADLGWFGACMFLTLPWSVGTFFLIIGAMHIFGDTGIFAVIGISALLNAFLLFLILRKLFRNRS